MKPASVHLYLRVRRPDGSRLFANPVSAANGKLRPRVALIDGQPVYCRDGVYHLRVTRDGKRCWENVGSDPHLALLARDRTRRTVDAVAVGVPLAESRSAPRTLLTEAIAIYLEDTRFTKRPRTASAYTETMRGFAESTPKRYLQDLDRRDVLGYMHALRQRQNSPRTIYNRIIYLRTFFLSQSIAFPLQKTDWPNYTDKVVACYREDEMRTLLAAADPDEREMIEFFLCMGGRKQEVQFAAWSDINWIGKTITVREKLDVDFRPKDREEGSVPLPDPLIEMLRERRARYPRTRFIFEKEGGRTEDHFLRVVKRIALGAGLNCGDCRSKSGKSCATHPVCKQIILHKLRKTYATMHHEAGVPARTIQRWLRHSDLDTTLRYLAASDDLTPKTRELVNGSFAGIIG